MGEWVDRQTYCVVCNMWSELILVIKIVLKEPVFAVAMIIEESGRIWNNAAAEIL